MHRRAVWSALGAAMVVCTAAGDASARGGLTWSPRGYNVFHDYLSYGTAWGALMGAGIPQRNLGPPNLNRGGPGGGSFHSHGGGLTTRSSNPMLRTTLPTLPTNPGHVWRPPQQAGFSFDPDRSGAGEVTPGTHLPPYFHNYNSYWLRGYWGGGMWGWGRWGGDNGIWSFPRWWLGFLYYATGYGLFDNPFVQAGESPPEYLDYSKPLQVSLERGVGAAVAPSRNQILRTPAQRAGLRSFDAAAAAFKAGNYGEARQQIEAALMQLPRDPALHEFRALVLFAQQEYRAAAETLYAVLAVSPGCNWTTLSSFYATQDDFTSQLRALEAHSRENVAAADLRFLLAYHYVTCGHFEAAVRQFAVLVRQVPGDELAPHLQTLVSGAIDRPVAAEPTVPADETSSLGSDRAAEIIAIDTAKLLGVWHAKRGGIVQIELELRPDQKFSWTAAYALARKQIDGVFVVDRDVLVMQGSEGEPLIGLISLNDKGVMNFKLIGADPADPGLDFAR